MTQRVFFPFVKWTEIVHELCLLDPCVPDFQLIVHLIIQKILSKNKMIIIDNSFSLNDSNS